MTGQHRKPRKLAPYLVTGVLVAALGFVNASAPDVAAAPTDLTGPFYNSPSQNVDNWVRDNPGDSRTPVIKRIADQPAAIWIGGWSSRADVSRVAAASAANGTTPVYVFYNIPDRDCGGYSGGGAPTIAAYDAWVKDMAAGLGTRQAAVVLEPDALNHTCGGQDRLSALGRAADSIHTANPKAKVYFDVGHSGWKVDINRLKATGINTRGDGIATNTSNFHKTADEITYAKSVLAQLTNKDLRAVIDVSRNGGVVPPGGTWCNPDGVKIGRNPTTATGDEVIDALLWVKLAGESDGDCNGNPPAGTFSPALAYALAKDAPASPPDPTHTPTPTPTPTPTVTPTPTPTGCSTTAGK